MTNDESTMAVDAVPTNIGVPSEIAQDFLEKHGADIHPIFDNKNALSSENSLATTINALEYSQSAKHQVEDFLKVMDTHKPLPSDYGMKLSDLRAKNSWEDMIKAATDAEKAYEAAGHHTLRKGGRWIQANSQMVLPFLRVIPNDFLASIFQGALRLVFEAIARVDEQRITVLKAFIRIPSTIMMAEDSVRNYPMDKLLFERAEGVFCAALPAIEGAIRWVRQNPVSKQFRALIRGPLYTKSFKEKLHALDEAVNDLKERASVLQGQSIRNTEEMVDNVQRVVQRTDTHMDKVAEDLKNISKAQHQTHAKFDNMKELEEAKATANKAIEIVLEQKLKTSEWMLKKDRVIRKLRKHVEALQRAEAAITVDDLRDILNFSSGFTSKEDLRRALRTCQAAADLSSFDVVRSLIESEKLSNWIYTDASAALFIEGSSSCSLSRITPLTYLSAKMVEKFNDEEPAVSIYYFCADHTSKNDPLRGPQGIIRSLIFQVLDLYPIKLDFISKRFRTQLENHHLPTLCDCFCKLVRQLPIDTVLVCVIDGISFFEKRDWINDCKTVLTEIQSLLEEDDLTPVFKLLVTSPVKSRHVANTFSEDSRITLPGDDRSGSRHAPTLREIAMTNRRQMKPNRDRRSFARSMRWKREHREVNTKESETSDIDSDSHSETDMNFDDIDTNTNTEMDVDADESQTDHSFAR